MWNKGDTAGLWGGGDAALIDSHMGQSKPWSPSDTRHAHQFQINYVPKCGMKTIECQEKDAGEYIYDYITGKHF